MGLDGTGIDATRLGVTAASSSTPPASSTRRQSALADAAPSTATTKRKRKIRSWWLKQLHSWHWISAALSLAGMLLFAVTGLTLNHAGSIGAHPRVTERSATLPPPLLALLKKTPPAADAPLPAAVSANLAMVVGLDAAGRPAEWADDAYVALPGPGRDAWLSIDRSTGAVSAEITDRGWVSYLNDLHKGRNAGAIWFWFIDVFAAACIVFTLTGFLLLQLHARHRPSTWPLVAVSLAIPVGIALLFIH
jgi:hypothetical protein